MMNKLNYFFRAGVLATIAIISFACSSPVETYQGPVKDKSFYGPQAQVYELPSVPGKIYYVSPDADVNADGLSIETPTTIEVAISKVVSGDAIVMRGGVYRTGNLTFNQGITIQPYRDEQPVLNGTLIAADWSKTADGAWVTKWDYLFPGAPESWWNRQHEEKFTPLHRFNNDGIFVDGKFLESVASKKDVVEGTYFVDYNTKEIYIGTDPTGKTVEITAFRKAIMRTIADVHGKKSDGRGPVIKGLIITQYPDTMVHIDGYYPQKVSSETEHGKDVIGTVFENCTFSKCFRIGVFAIGDSMVMRNCKIIDTNTEGLYLVASSDVLLERNIFANNNIERWTGFYPSSVKIFNQTHRVVCRNNLIIDQPNSNGLWYDVGNRDGVFVNNWVENIGNVQKFKEKEQIWSNFSGFFYEISSHAICAGNVFLNCEQGAFVLNSANVQLWNNTFVNSTASFGRNSRGDGNDHFGWHINTAPGVDARENHILKNNLFYMQKDLSRNSWSAWQPADMCERLNKSTLTAENNNFYVYEADELENGLILWSPAKAEKCTDTLSTPEELTALYPEFSTESKLFKGISTPFLTNVSANDFSLNAESAGKLKAAILPEEIIKVMNVSDKKASFVGAYMPE